MSINFVDISIVGMDDEASYKPDPNKGLYNVALKLSSDAPYDWANYFNRRWQQHIYMMKREATVSGTTLTVHCVPDELQNDHLPELNKVIAETNSKYKGYLASQLAQETAKEKAEAAERETLRNLKNTLNF